MSEINKNNLINKTYTISKENKRKNIIIKTAFKKNKYIDNYRINDFKNEKYNPEIKIKRIWSSQNIFISKNKEYGKYLFNKKYLYNTINFYCGSEIYRAPSVKENRKEINHLLTKKKNKRLNELNNMHNTMMINESKLYRQKIFLFSNDNNNNSENKRNNNIKNRYNMNDMNEINNIKINLKPKRFFKIKNYKRNFSGYLSLRKKKYNDIGYSNNNLLSNDNNTLSSNKTNYYSGYKTNKKEKTFYQLNEANSLSYATKIGSKENIQNKNNKISSLKNNNNILLYEYKKNNKQDKKFNNNKIIKDIEVSNMRLQLNDIIYNKKGGVLQLDELEKKLIKFNAFKDLQQRRLEIMSKKDINGLQKRILLLQENMKRYNEISINYFKKIKSYINFLNDKKYKLSYYYEEENNIRFSLFYEIEKLMIENVLKQKELEHLIEIRHFLIQVKNTLLKQPPYFNNILKEVSRKYELGKLILGLKIKPQNQNVIRFLESIPEIKEEEIPKYLISSTKNNNILKKKIKKNTQIFKDILNDNNINKYICNPEYQIFDCPDEFLIMFDNVESKNLRLMKENDDIKKNILILKKEYNEILQSNINLEKYNDIVPKEEKLKQLIELNNQLIQRHNYFKNYKEEKNNVNDKINEREKSYIMDLNVYKKLTYYKILKEYRYKGSLLLQKLVEIIKEFFSTNYSNYRINKSYKFVERNILNRILKINKKNINYLNQSYINKYILCLLKIYEDICEYIKFKDKQYNSIDSNKYIIHKKNEELQLQRKIKNARDIRQLEEEKRINGINKIIQKNKRPNLLFKGNIDDNVVIRNKIKKNKNSAEIGNIKKNYLENEFNFYVNYNNDNF